MSIAIVTGASGLVGSETVRFVAARGMDVWGIDNDMRQYFFGPEGSTRWKTEELMHSLPGYHHLDYDIRDKSKILELFRRLGADISLVVHCAAQPSHDWAAREPMTDFTVNALGTLGLLEATRLHCPEATFIFVSTNKVYGDNPNSLPLVEMETRWEPDPRCEYAEHGIDESMSIDRCKHSIFGASKVAADVMVQEYGRYFDMKTGVFRGGCITGAAHSGAELHGFLAYLVKCALTGKQYRIYGYKGKQVRDNIHAADLVGAFWHFHQNPRAGEVYNMGGSRHSHCSLIEAIEMIEGKTGKKISRMIDTNARIGDHIWWVSDVRKFQDHYPSWHYCHGLQDIITEIVEGWQQRLGRSDSSRG